MTRFLVLLVTLGAFWASTWFSDGSIGFSSECVNEQCFVYASTSITSILVGVFLSIFIIKFPRGGREDIEIRAGFWRRLAALYLDLMVLMISLGPLLALPAVLVEYIHTGVFSWMFHRDYSRSSDGWVILPSILFLFLTLLYYFYYFALVSRPTLGQFILGYRIVSTEGTMTPAIARKRVLFSVLGMFVWPIAVIHGLIKKRVFWWDSGSNSIAILTKADIS